MKEQETQFSLDQRDQPRPKISPKEIDQMILRAKDLFSDISEPVIVNKETADHLGISDFGLRRWVLMAAGAGVIPLETVQRRKQYLKVNISGENLLSILLFIKEFYSAGRKKGFENLYREARKTLLGKVSVREVTVDPIKTSERRISRRRLKNGDYLSLFKLFREEGITLPLWKVGLLFPYLRNYNQPVEGVAHLNKTGVMTYFGVPQGEVEAMRQFLRQNKEAILSYLAKTLPTLGVPEGVRIVGRGQIVVPLGRIFLCAGLFHNSSENQLQLLKSIGRDYPELGSAVAQ